MQTSVKGWKEVGRANQFSTAKARDKELGTRLKVQVLGIRGLVDLKEIFRLFLWPLIKAKKQHSSLEKTADRHVCL